MIVLIEEDLVIAIEAVERFKVEGRASVSILQRGFRLGYTRASLIMLFLEEKGVVKKPETPGAGPWQILNLNVPLRVGDGGSSVESQNLQGIFRDKDGAIRFLGHLIAVKQEELSAVTREIIRCKVAYSDLPKRRDNMRTLRTRIERQIESLKDARNVVAEAEPKTQAEIMEAILTI